MFEEPGHFIGWIVGRERAAEIELPAVAIGEFDRAGSMRCRAVQRGPQEEPPIQDVRQVPVHIQGPGRQPAHRRDFVGDECGDLFGVDPKNGARCRTF